MGLSSTAALATAGVVLAGFAAFGVAVVRGREGGVEDFLTARDSVSPRMLTATLVASGMGVWILLSPPEAGAAFGGVAAVAGYAVGEALPLLAYAELGPRIRELLPEGHSLTEYALARYGPAMYAFVLLVSVAYMFVFLAAELTGIASAFHLVAGVPRWQTGALVVGFVLLYTSYGGLPASVVTDAVQTLVILPLLALCAVSAVLALGGPTAVYGQVVAAEPSLVDPTFVGGLRFGFWVALAILGAELVNQTWWQRIYAAEDPATLRRGFRVAALCNVGVVFVAGLFGVAARGYVDLVTDPANPGYDASVAFFVPLSDAFPAWLVFAVVLLALLLVVSTADSLFNALASVVTADLPRVLDDPDEATLTRGARLLTVAVALAALFVSLRARSVLQLFLFADLLGVAVMVPLLYGLYSGRPGGPGMLAASLAGLAVGVVFFPDPLVRGTLEMLGPGAMLPQGDFLVAFVGAAVASTLVAVAAARLSATTYDLDGLARSVRRLDARSDGGESEE